MVLKIKAIRKLKHLNLPVSYQVLDDGAFSDSRNVYDNKGVLETRHGLHRYNATSLGGPILSLSFFKKNNGTTYKLAKVGTVLYSVSATGAATSIKTGLTATTKHRAVTTNNRHIVCIESDGMFSFDGTTFTQLGQTPPTAGTVAVSSGGTLTDANNFKVGLTFYASATGFETNVYESSQVTTATPNKQIDITAIPITADNGTIDKVRVYLKNTTSNTSYLFVTELSLGTASYTITTTPTSTLIPPTLNGVPLAGGGKYPTLFGKKFVYSGNSNYLSEVFISEEYLPDAFNGTITQNVLQISGQGPITGVATGYFSDQTLSPFIAIFKKTTIAIYSELNDIPTLNTLDTHVGCISHDTIRVRNGIVYFMSENGWYAISNGILIKDTQGMPVSLGGGKIDDIFSRVGWNYELNLPQSSTFFSAYFITDMQYFTFVCEGANTLINKAYVYEERVGGFKVYDFQFGLTCAIEGEDDDGYQCIFVGDTTGSLFQYSSRNAKHDQDCLGASQTISASAILPWIVSNDDASTYNFRTLTLRAFGSSNAITVRTFTSFNYASYTSTSYDFPNTSTGFVLDVSQLDVDTLGDERSPVTAIADINRTGEVIMIGFYQNILDANIGLISAQLDINKNGNKNL